MAEQTRVGARRRPDAARPGGGSSSSPSKKKATTGPDETTEADGTEADDDTRAGTDTDTEIADHRTSARDDGETQEVPSVAPEDSRWSDPDDDESPSGGPDTAADRSPAETSAASPLDQLKSLVRTRGPIRARKVHRIVRRVDPWSILKLCLLFYLCVWVMSMVAVVLLWGVAVGSGTIGSLENFIAEFLAFEEFRFNGDQLFQVVALGGLIGVFVATAVSAVLAVVFNLIADLTGGIRFTVVEEESARRILRTEADRTRSTLTP